MNKDIYILKKDDNREETDFQKLQLSALDIIQKLSGNLWTDYNIHDPGITIMDAFNYALSELNHKCNFSFEDYLSTSKITFTPKHFGLLKPYEAYPCSPITQNDFRKIIFDRIPNVTDLWLIPSKNRLLGSIDILVDLNPSVQNSEEGEIYNQVAKVFHENRNLGEVLNDIHFIERRKLSLKGDINLEEGADASEILSQIYFECAKYFIPGIHYSNMREMLKKGHDWTEIFDGPLLKNGFIENENINPCRMCFYVSDLHKIIRNIEGVRSVNNITVFGLDKEYGEEIEPKDLLKSFTIKFPSTERDLYLKLHKNGHELNINLIKAKKHYKKYIALQYGLQNRMQNIDSFFESPEGNYRELQEYHSIQNDFPDFYGINNKGIPEFFSDERKANAKQLKAYLLIFDMIMANSSNQLNEISNLLHITNEIPEEHFPQLENTVPNWDQLVTSERNKKLPTNQFFIKTKHAYFNLLDSLYGEKSILPFIKEFDTYSEGIKQQQDWLKQRGNFIASLPKTIPNRAKAVNLQIENPDNIPGLKQWFSNIIGIPEPLEIPVTNVFSKFSLRLLSDKEFYQDINGILNIDFVVNDLKENFKGENNFDVPEETIENPTNNYNEFKEKIYLLHHNIIFESFLRNGISLANYKIIQTEKKVFILAYQASQKEEWISLGRFTSKIAATNSANQLQQFLVLLNQQSENLYFIEHLLLGSNNNKDGYTVKIMDHEGKETFSLLKPINREEAFEVSRLFDGNLSLHKKLKIKKLQNNLFVIKFQAHENNAIYSNQLFETKKEALDYLKNKLNQTCSTKIFYQNSKGDLFPHDFMDMALTIVFPSWSARFHNHKFQKWCMELLEERCPAHMKIHFMWLEAPKIRTFEKLYFAWREAYAKGENIENTSINLSHFIIDNLNRNE